MSDPIPDVGSISEIYLSTPLTVIGIFVALLRERFDVATPSDPPLLWNWKGDPKTTDVFIESGFNENLEARDQRPGCWIDRDQTVYGQVSIGNQDQMPASLRQRFRLYFAPAEMDIVVDCTSKKRGESMLLGSIVHDFLQMSAREICSYFGFRYWSPVILNRTTPFEKDRTLWTSLVSFRVHYEARWATLPVTTLLDGISMRIADVADPAAYFRDITLRNE